MTDDQDLSDALSSLSSPLSSPPLSDAESPPDTPSDMASSPAPPSAASSARKAKREPSPPHIEVLADNPDVAFLVMFRARFHDAFPQKLINFGPQDIERGVVDTVPSPQVEALLCALLGLVLNRKKPVERGHYGRAMEDAMSSQKSQWPRSWSGINPLSGSKSFNTLDPQERLSLLKALAVWSLNSSDAITSIIKESYKQNRHDDDLNQPLSVQPWGRDGDKRRYWLVEGRDDTSFRLYRESNPALKTNTWWSMAGSIDELKEIGDKLNSDGSQAARRLSQRITNAIPRFEATEEKRKRREYRVQRKAQFTRPEPGYSMYEGRTRGKRMKYTYSDDEDMSFSENPEPRRSTRAVGLTAEPTVTASGRLTRPRFGNLYGSGGEGRASPLTDSFDRSEGSQEPNGLNGRATRVARNADRWAGDDGVQGYNEVDEMDDEDDAQSSGEEWQGEDELEDRPDNEGNDDASVDMSDEDLSPQSLLVTLKYSQAAKLQRLPERLNPTPTHSPVRPAIPTPAAKADDSAMDMDSPVKPTALPETNGLSIKETPPAATSGASSSATSSRPPMHPSFANFLFKPAPEPAAKTAATTTTTPSPAPPTPMKSSSSAATAAAPSNGSSMMTTALTNGQVPPPSSVFSPSSNQAQPAGGNAPSNLLTQ